jgi:sec-independent protein translocase protein TatC
MGEANIDKTRGGALFPQGDDDEEDGLARMSFLEHLGELRSRIIRALTGFGVVFLVCMAFSSQLWRIVQAPAAEALGRTGIQGAHLVAINLMEKFSIIWMWTPLVAAIFLGSPWIVYQVWAFIAPGLYKSERRWAVPFILATAGLFIAGGCFAYFVAFRYALVFLLGIEPGVTPLISIDSYFDTFVDVMLGISAVFEMPVIIFFLVLLRLATPKFLMEHSRYAILAIVILAAIITPTPDVFNLMLFAAPMCLLFFVGVFAGYLLVIHREGKRFAWGNAMLWLVVIASTAILGWVIVERYHLHIMQHWPFWTR